MNYKISNIDLAQWGRKEIKIAEHEMPGLNVGNVLMVVMALVYGWTATFLTCFGAAHLAMICCSTTTAAQLKRRRAVRIEGDEGDGCHQAEEQHFARAHPCKCVL